MSELPSALIFDVDGTLADTERDGHRVAYNNTFEKFGLDWFWSVEEYGELLEVTGGKERMKFYLDRLGKKVDSDLLNRIYDVKSEKFQHMIRNGHLKLRTGVKRIIGSARASGVRLAIATTTNPGNVTNLLESNLGKESIGWFDVIAAGDIVPAKKPAPDIYHYAMQAMGIGPEHCVALEDSANGLRSARAAHLPTLITITDYTADEDFSDAGLVVTNFGDEREACEVLLNPHRIPVNGMIEMDVLSRIAQTA